MSLKTNTYKITQVTHYDGVELDVVVGYFESAEEEIENIVNQKLRTVLVESGLHVIFGDDYFVITDKEREKYRFRVCTKELPPPIDARKISEEEKFALLHDERYMTTPDDYQEVDWSVSEVYKKLREQLPHKDSFSFSSLAYGIEKYR